MSTSAGTSQYSPHWDGNSLLFITDSSGALLQINIEDLGAIVVKPAANSPHLTVFDRDYGGQEVGIHASTGTNFLSGNYGQWVWVVKAEHWVQGTAQFASGISGPVVWPCFPQCGANGPSQVLTTAGTDMNVLFDSGRNDGYFMAGLSIQGARAYDSGTRQWSTPDAFKGDVHDPMSQRSYMWNNNNPVAYEDPSGYEGFGIGLQGNTAGLPGSLPRCKCGAYVQISGGVGFLSGSHTWTSDGSHGGSVDVTSGLNFGEKSVAHFGRGLAAVLRGSGVTATNNFKKAAKSIWSISVTAGVAFPANHSTVYDAVNQTHGGANVTLCGDGCVQGSVGKDGAAVGIGGGFGAKYSISPPSGSQHQH